MARRKSQKIGDPAELLKSFKKEEWNTYRIVCRGPEITLYVNGVLMCQITDNDASTAGKSGIIALQMHPGPPMKVQFKNICPEGIEMNHAWRSPYARNLTIIRQSHAGSF